MSERVDPLYPAWSGPREGWKTPGCKSRRGGTTQTVPAISPEERAEIEAIYRAAGMSDGQIRAVMGRLPDPVSPSFPDGLAHETARTEAEVRERRKVRGEVVDGTTGE